MKMLEKLATSTAESEEILIIACYNAGSLFELLGNSVSALKVYAKAYEYCSKFQCQNEQLKLNIKSSFRKLRKAVSDDWNTNKRSSSLA